MEYFIGSIRRITSRIDSSHRRLEQLVNGKRIKFKPLLFTVNDDVIEWKYNGRPTTLYSTKIEPEFPWHLTVWHFYSLRTYTNRIVIATIEKQKMCDIHCDRFENVSILFHSEAKFR